MTRTRHLTRTAVLATSSALLAIAATGTAAAWTRSAAPTAAAAAPVTAVVAPAAGTTSAGVALASSVTAPAPRQLTEVVRTATTTAATAVPSTASAGRTVKKRTPKPVVISRYTYAPGSQRAIDQCRLVLWSTRPMWLAAHNYCGYQWMSSVAKGRTIEITSGKAAGTYVVTGHLRLTRQSGSMPVVKADLVLQTCVGSGTGLTLARRVR